MEIARAERRDVQFAHAKEFHVSPFMGMDMEYRWRLTEPGSELRVQLANSCNCQGSQLFDASMTLQRRELMPATTCVA